MPGCSGTADSLWIVNSLWIAADLPKLKSLWPGWSIPALIEPVEPDFQIFWKSGLFFGFLVFFKHKLTQIFWGNGLGKPTTVLCFLKKRIDKVGGTIDYWRQ